MHRCFQHLGRFGPGGLGSEGAARYSAVEDFHLIAEEHSSVVNFVPKTKVIF